MSDIATKTKGRPPGPVFEITEEQQKVAITMAVEGNSIASICRSLLITRYQFWRYRETFLGFNNKFHQARQEGLEDLADGLLTIADDMTIDVQRARLKSDNVKWILSKRKPGTYGEKLDLNISASVDISDALNAAKSRLVGPIDTDALTLDITPEKKELNK